MHGGSENAGDESLSFRRIIGESFFVPEMMRTRSREQVGHGPDCKHERWKRECAEGKAHPFDDFTQIVGAGDPAIEAASRNVVTGFPRLS